MSDSQPVDTMYEHFSERIVGSILRIDQSVPVPVQSDTSVPLSFVIAGHAAAA